MNNEQLNEQIDALWAQTKAGNLPREQRFEAIERLTEEYIVANGKRPDTEDLDRLASLCLYEELTDDTPWKTQNTEYPIHSEEQRIQIEKNEVGMKALGLVDSNRRQISEGKRRKRSDYENSKANKVRSRNLERKRKYRDFTKPQPVIIYKINQ